MYRHRDYSICSIHFLFFFFRGVSVSFGRLHPPPSAWLGRVWLHQYLLLRLWLCIVWKCNSDLPIRWYLVWGPAYLRHLYVSEKFSLPSPTSTLSHLSLLSLSLPSPSSLSLPSPSSLSLTSHFHFLLSLPLPPLPSYLTFTNTNSSLLLYLFLQINIHEFLYYPCVVTGHNHRAYTSTQ